MNTFNNFWYYPLYLGTIYSEFDWFVPKAGLQFYPSHCKTINHSIPKYSISRWNGRAALKLSQGSTTKLGQRRPFIPSFFVQYNCLRPPPPCPPGANTAAYAFNQLSTNQNNTHYALLPAQLTQPKQYALATYLLPIFFQPDMTVPPLALFTLYNM